LIFPSLEGGIKGGCHGKELSIRPSPNLSPMGRGNHAEFSYLNAIARNA